MKPTFEEYEKSSNEFKNIIDSWINVYRDTTFKIGAKETETLIQIGKVLEETAGTFDNMLMKDCVEINGKNTYNQDSVLVNPYFCISINTELVDYRATKIIRENIENARKYSAVKVNDYIFIASRLREFKNNYTKFVLSLQKFHGKTKVRRALDSIHVLNNYYWNVEKLMYQDIKGVELCGIF